MGFFQDILQQAKDEAQGKAPSGESRSSQWPKVRKAFLAGKACAVCGGTAKLEAHHKIPFHLDRSKELDPTNLIALCEGIGTWNHHLWVGHLGNFRSYNPQVAADAEAWANKIRARPEVSHA